MASVRAGPSRFLDDSPTMKSWIFQANPDAFDIDGYLAATPGVMTWLVKQNARQIHTGDSVFIWRSKGSGKKPSGVIASAEVISEVSELPEPDEAATFWKGISSLAAAPRVWLKIIRVASGVKFEIKRDWLVDEPALKNTLILKQPAGTNFPLTATEARRLEVMWSRVGHDWTRPDSVAGLWAYAHTYGQPVSKLPGSPVFQVSQVTGRAVSGVYNKVMNFRSIDPRESRAGMSGGGDTDRAVWAEFYDATADKLNLQALDREFIRLWGEEQEGSPAPAVESESAAFAGEVERLSERPFNELMDAYLRQQAKSAPDARPRAASRSTTAFVRNPLVVALAKLRAENKCEVPACAIPRFADVGGEPYCEVHHITPLAEGGRDVLENVACVCPLHHREVHLGKYGGAVRTQLLAVRSASVAAPAA